MDIELIATSTVKNSIAQTDILTPSINEGDKEPSWDGVIYIYRDSNKTKEGVKRVPVQVKGKAHSDFSKDEIAYPVSLIDLNNYLYDGGVIFFVVLIADKGTRTKIYYNTLTPVKLRSLIDPAKGQASKSIRLKEFPQDNAKKVAILLNFYEDKTKQASFIFEKLPTIDELIEQDILFDITVSVSTYSKDEIDLKRALIENENYFYAQIKGSKVPQPLDFIPEKICTHEKIVQPVFANGVLFYEQYDYVMSKDKDTFRFGNSLLMEYNRKLPEWKVTYKPLGKLRDRIKDMAFMKNVLEARSFCIHDKKIHLIPTMNALNALDLPKHNRMLAAYEKLSKALRLFGVDDDLDIDAMSDKDWVKCTKLVVAAIDKKPVSGLSPDLNPILIFDICNLHLALVFEKTDEEGTYNIFDFFKTEFDVAMHNEKNELMPASQYALLQKQHYLTLSNIQYDVVVASFKKVGNHDQINMSLLEMLAAYDESGEQRLFEAIRDISQWLYNAQESSIPFEVRLLNGLQVVKRERALSTDEKRKLIEIVEMPNQREDVKVGAYLLLDNQVAAEVHLNRIDADYQDEFKQYPIFRFWQRSKEDNHNGQV